MTQTPLSRSKGRSHQAALLTAAFTHQAAAAVTEGTYSTWEPIATLRPGAAARRREALRGLQREERDGVYCGGRPPTACL